jgi:Zn-finger nucleic acid-binding protein
METMNCPTCTVVFQMTERQGVEIDYCPKCRGVWLDKGELDRIIQRALLERRSEGVGNRKDENDGRHEDNQSHEHSHKKKGFWGDLFG